WRSFTAMRPQPQDRATGPARGRDADAAARRGRTPSEGRGRPAGSRFQRLQLVDEPGDHRQAELPEFRPGRVEAERRQELRMMPRAAGLQHVEVLLHEALVRLLVQRIERVHQAIAECVGIDVERRVDEVRYVAPERLVAVAEMDRGAETFPLDLQPLAAD